MAINGKTPRWKFLFFSLFPAFLLLVVGEVFIRMANPPRSQLLTLPLPEEYAGLFVPDPELFWRLRPNLDATYQGIEVTSNSLGLRSPEIGPKGENEFRILSLGESTTFGVGVSNEETYTSLLGKLLGELDSSREFVALNAGVSAWSSFQSLKYLETRGLSLDPDLILFYHELNDYLPSTLRDSSNSELGARQTDRELYESRQRSGFEALLQKSALFRYLQSLYAYWSVKRFNREDFDNPLTSIGLPDIGINNTLGRIEGEKWIQAELNEMSLGRRVSDQERRHILSRLVRLCRENNIALVVIHPAYRSTARHECLLTDFCRDRKVLMYEAYDALHPHSATGENRALYLDRWHPTAQGHERLARGLAKFLQENLFPPDKFPRDRADGEDQARAGKRRGKNQATGVDEQACPKLFSGFGTGIG